MAQRAMDSLERSTSTIPLNASGGESGSDLGHAFGFPFFLFSSFYIFMSCSISTKILSVALVERCTSEANMCQIPNTAWSLCQERSVRA